MALATQSLPPIRQVIARHGLSARKSLGQHFLLDLNLTRKIVRAAQIGRGVTVLEIGAGPGGLTRALLESPAAKIIAVERDPRAIGALHELALVSGDTLEVVNGDALKLNVEEIIDHPTQIVANLPYNIGTRLLLRYLSTSKRFERMTLLFQKEVADRLAASPGSRAYGRLSVIVQWLCEVRVLFDIPAKAFTPEPKVVSSVVDLVPRDQPLATANKSSLELVTGAAFGQRRKMLRTSLKALHVDSRTLLNAAGVSPTARPEEISVSDFCSLSRALDSVVDWQTKD